MAFPKHTHKYTFRMSLGVIVVIIGLLVFGMGAQGSQKEPVVTPEALPTPWHARLPNVLYPGIWHFMDLDLAARDYDYLKGSHRVWGWDELNPAPDVYRWHAVESWIEKSVAGGKPVALGVNTYDGVLDGGDHTPGWVYDHIPDARLVCPDGWTMPKFWDARWQEQFERFIAAFADRYDGDPRVAWVEISVGVYGETAPESFTQRWYVNNCLKPAGLNSILWEETVKRITDIYVRHFQSTPLFLQMYPTYESRRERREFVNYAASKGVGLKSNGLRAEEDSADYGECPPDGSGYWSPCEAGIVQLMRKWGDSVPIAWEGDPRFFRPGLPAVPFPDDHPHWAIYWQILNALDKHSDYILYAEHLAQNPLVAPLFRWANRYLGRTVYDTPSVWVVLRETALTRASNPQYGNFSFYLYQNDQVPGGRSVPVWDVGPYPEGYYARRTDFSTGNYYLYFDVDDRYLYDGNAREVIIRVTYLDEGNDAWTLEYDGQNDPYTRAGVVRKHNTRTWQVAEFRLTDFKFANRQFGGGAHPGSDFRIFSVGDGDDIIHFVEVEKVPFETPTPTPVPTRVRPPTPTPAKVVYETILQEGRDGYTGTKDTYLQEVYPYARFGEEETLSMCATCDYGGKSRHVLIQFDLAQGLPPGARIEYAWLALNLIERRGGKGMYARAYKLLRPWAENLANWLQASPGNLWEEPGAQGPSDRTSHWNGQGTVITPGRWMRVNVTDFALQWQYAPGYNFGIVLIPFSKGSADFVFASSEHPDVHRRPMLIVGYTLPFAPTPTPTATPTPTVTPTPTITPTPTPSLAYWLITGILYDASKGQSAGIAGGTITTTLGTEGPQLVAHADEKGRFALAGYGPDKGGLRYEASAPGYIPTSGERPAINPRRYTLLISLQPMRRPRFYFPILWQR